MRTENPCVGGSILPLATNKLKSCGIYLQLLFAGFAERSAIIYFVGVTLSPFLWRTYASVM